MEVTADVQGVIGLALAEQAARNVSAPELAGDELRGHALPRSREAVDKDQPGVAHPCLPADGRWSDGRLGRLSAVFCESPARGVTREALQGPREHRGGTQRPERTEWSVSREVPRVFLLHRRDPVVGRGPDPFLDVAPREERVGFPRRAVLRGEAHGTDRRDLPRHARPSHAVAPSAALSPESPAPRAAPENRATPASRDSTPLAG